MSFKVGQKVIFIGFKSNILEEIALMNPPKVNEEVVTISNITPCQCGGGDIIHELVEYPLSKHGRRQGFWTSELRPVVDDFAENLLEGILEKAKKEAAPKELVEL